MRTTLDIPDGLGKKVKMAAIQRGTTMRGLVVLALEHELGKGKSVPITKTLQFPLLPSAQAGRYELKPEEISDILIKEESAAYETSDRR